MDPHELALWEAWETSRSDSDRNALVTYYMPILLHLANRLVKRFQSVPPLELQELINEGVPALINRIETFDRTRNLQFQTWADKRVYGAMLDALRNYDWVSRSVRIAKKRDPTIPIVEMLPLASVGGSEYAPRARHQIGADVPGVPDPPGSMERAEFWKVACKGLRRTERLVLLMRYHERMTMADIGMTLDLSESRVSQLLKAILIRLRSRTDVQDIRDAA